MRERGCTSSDSGISEKLGERNIAIFRRIDSQKCRNRMKTGARLPCEANWAFIIAIWRRHAFDRDVVQVIEFSFSGRRVVVYGRVTEELRLRIFQSGLPLSFFFSSFFSPKKFFLCLFDKTQIKYADYFLFSFFFLEASKHGIPGRDADH